MCRLCKILVLVSNYDIKRTKFWTGILSDKKYLRLLYFSVSLSFKYFLKLDHQQNSITDQPLSQFKNIDVVVGLGDELNAELKTTVQI